MYCRWKRKWIYRNLYPLTYQAMKIRFFLFLMVVFSQAFSQSGYKINFKIKGWKDKTAYLGTYWGETTYIKDTARVNKSGEFSFDSKTALPQGVYMLILNKNKS